MRAPMEWPTMLYRDRPSALAKPTTSAAARLPMMVISIACSSASVWVAQSRGQTCVSSSCMCAMSSPTNWVKLR